MYRLGHIWRGLVSGRISLHNVQIYMTAAQRQLFIGCNLMTLSLFTYTISLPKGTCDPNLKAMYDLRQWEECTTHCTSQLEPSSHTWCYYKKLHRLRPYRREAVRRKNYLTFLQMQRSPRKGPWDHGHIWPYFFWFLALSVEKHLKGTLEWDLLSTVVGPSKPIWAPDKCPKIFFWFSNSLMY